MKERINKCKKQITSSFASFFNRAVRKEISPNVIIILFVIVAVAFIETLRRDLNLATALMAFGTLILAFVTSLSIMNSRDKENRDRKERLLNEIIEWAEDINNASLTPDVSHEIKHREANVLMRYGISLAKATSIETIASESFKTELFGNVNEVIDTLFRFVCVEQLRILGTMPTEEYFPETVIQDIEKEINEAKISFDELWTKYAKKLSVSIHNLLQQANKIKAGNTD